MTHSIRWFHVKVRPRGPPGSQNYWNVSFLALFLTVIWLRSHCEKFNIDNLAKKKFRSQYTCGEARKKIWDKKSMLNFSRQAYNEKVTDCHTLFIVLRFFELGCFLGRNIDLGGLFPTHDLKFGQFCNSTKNFGRPKFCWNFSEIFRFFFEQFWKKYYFPGSFFTENFAKWLWILAIFHKPLVYEGLWKIAKTWKKWVLRA